MDGDTISMTINPKAIKTMEEQRLHTDPIQEEDRESRYSQFHRRARLRLESETPITAFPAAADSSAVGDVLIPQNRGTRTWAFFLRFMGRFFYYLFQVK